MLADRQGIPLALDLTGANVADCHELAPLLAAVPPIHRPRGRPRRRPEKLHGDKAYDSARCRTVLRARRILARIARRGIDSSERLGRVRWVIERTLAWFGQFRRLAIRYERRLDIHRAWHDLAAGLICWNFVQRFC